ncbi:DMT family transporter [Flexivirga meconopsidis]|uniref:DMT family transporter n=1 Tax=Flexivirga meconopsidis TaxID=2977121 RepID=UPI0022401024|nr:DMT family transporter [Flexivirga meconopsidis]
MRNKSSATGISEHPLSGVGWGIVGVTAFSFTVPLTRVAVDHGGLSALFVGAGRAVVAAVLAAAALVLTRQPVPRRGLWPRIAIVAFGVVIGFPLLTSFALTRTDASHGAVVIALLPAATAVIAVRRGGEQVGRSFWVAVAVGAAAAVLFATAQGSSTGSSTKLGWPDLLLFGAVVSAAVGYAEGGLLAREIGSWQTVSWALVLSAPLMVVLSGGAALATPQSGSAGQWLAFGYLGVVSMFLGFFAWYRGLAIGPMARVSQVQLLQPVLSICWAALLIGERLTWQTMVGAAGVIAGAGLAVRRRRVTAAPSSVGGGAVSGGRRSSGSRERAAAACRDGSGRAGRR